MIGNVLLNRYKIESELGRGGMGVVYHAQDNLLNRAVAIKFLNTEGVDIEGKTRLLQEARAVAQLNHPNIVSVYDVSENDGNPFIVMELVQGDTLRKAEKPTLVNAIHMIQQICLSLDHAHNQGIIHRDLKLENIVVTNTQTLKLMDFGLAHTPDDAQITTEEGTLMGTVAYLAPELIHGQSASVQSDLYALGIILYELIVGHVPFQGNVGTVLDGHMHGEITPPSNFANEIPDWVDDLVLGLLSKLPEERPVSARAVLDILEQKITPPITAPYQVVSKSHHNLPAQNTSFIGREKEIAEISKNILSQRLVTLTGIGGTGKTRLALQIASDAIKEFPDGVWFIELASITEPNMIPHAILSSMDIPEQTAQDDLQFLAEYLKNRKLLLVLDNCEHLIETCAKIAKQLIRDAANISIITTSREALGIQGELIWQVSSLSLPGTQLSSSSEEIAQFEAVQLFIERASLVQPKFQLTNKNASFVARICSRLDGIPLAIELAAARVRSMSVDDIAKRLEDRFRLLMGGNRSGLERHQTLRATITWSYNLLSEEEKHLLCNLSVFSGGWTLEAAEQVCGDKNSDLDVLDTLTRLVEKSLVNLDESRYRMLETTRQFALEKLLESEDGSVTHDKHAAYILELSRLGNKYYRGPDHLKWKERFEKEIDNFRTAIEWQIAAQNTEAALHLLGSEWGWTIMSFEMDAWFNKICTLPNISAYPAPYAKALNFMGAQFRDSMDISKNRAYLEEAQEIWNKLGADGEIGLAKALLLLGEITLYNAEDNQKLAHSFFERGYALYQHHNDKHGIAWAILQFGNLAYQQGQHEEAEKQYTTSLTKFQEIGDQNGMAFAHAVLGDLMRVKGDYEQASNYWKKNLEIFREIHAHSAFIYPLTGLAWASLRKGEHEKAKNLFREALGLSKEYGNTPMVTFCIAGLASVLGSTDKPQQAARLFNAVDTLRKKMGEWEPADQKDIDHYLEVAREQLDELEFEKAQHTGQTMTIEQAIEYALEYTDE